MIMLCGCCCYHCCVCVSVCVCVGVACVVALVCFVLCCVQNGFVDVFVVVVC